MGIDVAESVEDTLTTSVPVMPPEDGKKSRQVESQGFGDSLRTRHRGVVIAQTERRIVRLGDELDFGQLAVHVSDSLLALVNASPVASSISAANSGRGLRASPAM